jgi:hypothetical protein
MSVTMRKLIILSFLFIPLLQAETSKLPKDKELKTLVFDSLSAFNKAVQEKNFTQFHQEQLSPEFQKQVPLEKFTAAFQAFIDKGYDISNIAKSEPVFDVPPAIDSDGLLVLKGHYPTQPNRVTFDLTYIYKSPAWKLLGLNVKATPFVANTGKVPTDKELKTLTLNSLLLFNTAIQTKNFDSFYDKSAKLWQKETTPEKMLEVFQSFIDKEIDIAPIAELKPIFEGTPAVNEDGFLMIKGSYAMESSKVAFQLQYVYEDESWKLAGINVQVKPTADKADDE